MSFYIDDPELKVIPLHNPNHLLSGSYIDNKEVLVMNIIIKDKKTMKAIENDSTKKGNFLMFDKAKSKWLALKKGITNETFESHSFMEVNQFLFGKTT